MNKHIVIGRLAAAPELKVTPSGKKVTTFTLAVDGGGKDQNGNRLTDWLDFEAWEKTAEFIARNFGKGGMIALVGKVKKRSYTAQDGTKRFATYTRVDEAFYAGDSKKYENGGAESFAGAFPSNDGMEDLENDDELPF